MPNYIIFNPTSTPVAGLVIGYKQSFPQERESELGVNILADPDLTGITIGEAKVVDGNLINLTELEKTNITASRDLAIKTGLMSAAKNIFLTPTNSQDQAIKLGFEVMLEMMVSELNILRAAVSPPLAARTNTQVKNAFKTSYENKIDNL